MQSDTLPSQNQNRDEKDNKVEKDERLTRDSIQICKDNSKSIGRRYFVTAAIAGAPLDRDFFESVLTYCSVNETELVILPMRGINSKDIHFCPEIQEHADKLATEIIFNSRIRAQDFMINPQMINPLTGLQRYGLKKHSLIIASPKQFMLTVPVSNEDGPNIIHSTGSITLPNYAQNRQGRLAEQDHCRGGIILEIENSTKFYIRQAVADKSGGFYDLGVLYYKKKIERQRCSAFVMGDYHCGFQNQEVIKNWVECIKETNPKYIIFHDIFDGHSISHHHNNDIERQVNRKKEIDTLEKELNYVGNELREWHNLFPEKELIIVHSNHDDFLRKYLTTVEYRNDRINHKLALQLAIWYLDGNNPIEKYIEKYFKIPNLKWLLEDKDYKLHDVRIGNHGHKPRNNRGSSNGMEGIFGNCIIAHGHAPKIFRLLTVVGTSTDLYLDYTKGSPTNWLNTSALLYKNSKKQLISSIDGKWRIGC